MKSKDLLFALVLLLLDGDFPLDCEEKKSLKSLFFADFELDVDGDTEVAVNVVGPL